MNPWAAMTLLAVLTPAPESIPPPLQEPNWMAERARFPPRESVASALAFNDAFRKHCEQMLIAVELIQDRDRRKEARCFWSSAAAQAANAHGALSFAYRYDHEPPESQEFWSHWMPLLRNRIGEDAYLAGRLPPPAPLWAFRATE
jgi:hypothetical protein